MHNDLSVSHYKIDDTKNELNASIVIPFHGGYNLLARTIASLTQQSYPEDRFEVVIVADARHSEARCIVDRYKRKINIKLINLFDTSLCLSSSRNSGIKIAKGDVIVSLTQI